VVESGWNYLRAFFLNALSGNIGCPKDARAKENAGNSCVEAVPESSF